MGAPWLRGVWGAAAACAVGLVAPIAVAAGTEVSANATAFAGLGRLAYSDSAGLWVMDGQTESVTLVPNTGGARDLRWSSDGRLLSFVLPGAGGAAVLHLLLPGGTVATVGGLPPASAYQTAWSPKGESLAVAPAGGGGVYMAVGAQAWYVAGSGSAAVQQVFWSHDAQTLEFGDGRQITTLSAGGGTPVARATRGPAGDLRPLGFAPDGSAIFYADAGALDRLPLTAGPASPTIVAGPLAPGTAPAWSPDGRCYAVVTGDGSAPWSAQNVAADCGGPGPQPLGLQPGAIAFDPSWSPDGRTLALVEAQQEQGLVDPVAWAQSEQLWVASADGRSTTALPVAGGGVRAPRWSGDGRTILYLRDGGLAAAPADGASPVVAVLRATGGTLAWDDTVAWAPNTSDR